jgi:hypothetical protein
MKTSSTTQLFHTRKLKLLALVIFSLACSSSYAQNADKEEYLIARVAGSGNYYKLYIDYSNYTLKENYPMGEPINDSLGKTMRFASETAALNYIGKLSWVMFAVIPPPPAGTGSDTKYIFKRKLITETSQLKTTAE